MITARAFAGKRYGIYGLARSGSACVAALTASGAQVFAWDDGEAARAGFDGPLTDLNGFDLAIIDALIVSPGVPHSAPLFVAAKAADIPVIGDIELFAQSRPELPPHKVVGITGTNGKSTTTALIHHVLQTAGVPSLMGGNIGLPILAQQPLPDGGVYVLELSSYQLEITETLNCDVAVLLNITPDHLDRHGTMAAYLAAKRRLFDMQTAADTAVIAVDDRYCRDLAATAVASVVPVSAARIVDDGVSIVEHVAWIGTTSLARAEHWATLQGPHNAQNAAAAIAVCRALGVPNEVIIGGLATYPGLPHRMQRVRETGGVLYVNDSKATNADSAAPALAAFPRIHWIAGGLAKTDELDACLPQLGHVREVYLIGDAAPLFGRLLSGKVSAHESGTLDVAVGQAAAAAQPGDTVLLSPACASFDQFTDYEARGRAFIELVEALP